MANNMVLEIKNSDGKSDLIFELIDFFFDESPHISPGLGVGAGINNSRKIATVYIPTSGEKQIFHIFKGQSTGKVFTEMIIRGNFSSGTNGTQTLLTFTLSQQIKILTYNITTRNGEQVLEVNVSFEKMTKKNDSTAGVKK